LLFAWQQYCSVETIKFKKIPITGRGLDMLISDVELTRSSAKSGFERYAVDLLLPCEKTTKADL
jgi:hypothetical protein